MMKALPPPYSFSIEHGFIWYRVAKTGTNTLQAVLSDRVADYQRVGWNSSRARDLELLAGPNVFSFTIVRNPWTRLRSAWADKIARQSSSYPLAAQRRRRRLERLGVQDAMTERRVTQDFNSFVQLLPKSDLVVSDNHFRPQSAILKNTAVEFTGRFEEYAGAVAVILHRLGLEQPIFLPRRNASTSQMPPLSTSYSRSSREIVADVYAADIERWSYRFES